MINILSKKSDYVFKWVQKLLDEFPTTGALLFQHPDNIRSHIVFGKWKITARHTCHQFVDLKIWHMLKNTQGYACMIDT